MKGRRGGSLPASAEAAGEERDRMVSVKQHLVENQLRDRQDISRRAFLRGTAAGGVAAAGLAATAASSAQRCRVGS